MKKYILYIALLVTSLAFSQGGYTKPLPGTGTVTSIATTLPITGGTITTTGTIGINQSTTSTDGYLRSTDWNTFNDKVTNATHTGEVTGATALTVDATAISNKTTVTPVATDMLLLWDATDSALKKVDANDFLGSGIAHLEWNDTDKTVWNNGKGNIDTNTSFGDEALKANTTGLQNTTIGVLSLESNTMGDNNTASGGSSLGFNTIGSNNTGNGFQSLVRNTTGSSNIAVGYQSGAFLQDGTTPNTAPENSVFLGAFTRTLAATDTNQIVIGHLALSSGSNTVTIGNSSITKTYLKGILSVGTVSEYADNAAALAGGLVIGQVYRTADILKIVH